MKLFVRRFPTVGTTVQKLVGVIAVMNCSMICIVLYFIKCFCWLIHGYKNSAV